MGPWTLKHYTYSEYITNPAGCKSIHPTAMENIYDSYFSFAFTRNPFDRLLSEFKWQGHVWWEKYDLFKYKFNFKNFVKHIVAMKLPFSHHRFTSQIHDNKHRADKDWSMVQFVEGDVDFIGKFENLQEDFNIICDKIGIERQELPHKNKSKHRHYTEYYDDETRQIVAERYAKDIEYFGYKFGE